MGTYIIEFINRMGIPFTMYHYFLVWFLGLLVLGALFYFWFLREPGNEDKGKPEQCPFCEGRGTIGKRGRTKLCPICKGGRKS